MSGAHRKWTPEQRAAAAERLRVRNSDPAFAAKRTAWMHDPDRKDELRRRGKQLADVRSNDIVVNSTWLAGCYRAANRPEKRERSREVMKITVADRSIPIAGSIASLNAIDPSTRSRKGWLTRRRNNIVAALARRKSRLPTVRT